MENNGVGLVNEFTVTSIEYDEDSNTVTIGDVEFQLEDGELMGSADSYDGLPVIGPNNSSLSEGDFAVLRKDDGDYLSGIYVYDGSEYVFNTRIMTREDDRVVIFETIGDAVGVEIDKDSMVVIKPSDDDEITDIFINISDEIKTFEEDSEYFKSIYRKVFNTIFLEE